MGVIKRRWASAYNYCLPGPNFHSFCYFLHFPRLRFLPFRFLPKIHSYSIDSFPSWESWGAPFNHSSSRTWGCFCAAQKFSGEENVRRRAIKSKLFWVACTKFLGDGAPSRQNWIYYFDIYSFFDSNFSNQQQHSIHIFITYNHPYQFMYWIVYSFYTTKRLP